MRVEVKNYWRFNLIGGTEKEKCKKKLCWQKNVWPLGFAVRGSAWTENFASWSKFKLILILQLKGYNQWLLFVKRTFQIAGWYLADLSPFKTSRPVNHQVISRKTNIWSGGHQIKKLGCWNDKRVESRFLPRLCNSWNIPYQSRREDSRAFCGIFDRKYGSSQLWTHNLI